ncbi:MAG: HDOD domain-containing protein [Proteobacteria bacterium]|nr:HDOD domain-containing protein [Pseudomonadota bacterium]
MTETSIELTRRLSAAVERMPAFPKSVQRILELSRDINCSPKELVMVIEKDPVMTMKLLRVINSACYGLPKQITSVNQAMVYLGLNTVKNMALSFAAMGALPPQISAGFDIQGYLIHSLTTAGLARTLCQKYRRDDTDPADCYIAGLLHDFGKVVLAQFLTEEFRNALSLSIDQSISLHLAEQQIIGTDHTVIGAMLMEKWQFPRQLTETIRNHHGEISADDTVQSCLFAANQISKQLGLGNSGNLLAEELPPALAERFGGELSDLIASLGDISRLTSEAQVFTQAGRRNTA